MRLQEAIDMFKSKANRYRWSYNNFYCRITKNIDERMAYHRAECICYLKAKSHSAACRLEEALAAEGFNTGARPGNGGDEETVYVYMYLMTAGTVETDDDLD